MSSSVVYANSFNSKMITISAPRLLQSGAKQAYLNYGGERLLMQTATSMSVPFGLNVSEFGALPEYSVNVSFRGHELRAEVKEFMETMNQMDEFMISEGVKNSKAWFKADLSRDVVKAFYTPSVKYSKDKEGNVLSYPPNIKLKLRKANGVFDTKFYDIQGKPYTNVPVEDLLVKGVQLTAIMECGGVWFAGSKFGLTWRAKQIAIHKLPEKVGDFAFKGLGPAVEEEEKVCSVPKSYNDEVDDEAVFAAKPSVLLAVMPSAMPLAMPLATPSAMPLAMPSADQLQDDPVDDEDGDDLEPVPVPKKTIVKKKVIGVAKK
jgi:hypothetical protein